MYLWNEAKILCKQKKLFYEEYATPCFICNFFLYIIFLCFRYMTSACDTLKLILKLFGSVIRNNVQSPVGSFGVDIPREERYQKCVKCYEYLNKIRSLVVKKQSLPGSIGSSLREIHTLMQSQLDWRPPKMCLLKFKNASVWWQGWETRAVFNSN